MISILQLGIRKVFEPRQADFAPMTSQRGIYVTNIEQAITVTIRNYVDPNTIQGQSKYLRNVSKYICTNGINYHTYFKTPPLNITLFKSETFHVLKSGAASYVM